MYGPRIDLNDLKNKDSNIDACDSEDRLNFVRHVKEASSQRFSDSQCKVAKDILHSVVVQQCVLPDSGEPRTVTLTRCH